MSANEPAGLTEAPVGMPYRHYWNNEEYRDGLRAEIDAAVQHGLNIAADKRVITEAIMSMVFKRVKLHTWCDREGCMGERCAPTHYTFDVTTHPRRFAPEEETR